MDTTQSQTTNRGASSRSSAQGTQGRGPKPLLWGTRTGKYERLLRARCRGEVRGRRGMRLWFGRGSAGGQEVDVLRVTSSLVSISAGLRSITQLIQRTG